MAAFRYATSDVHALQRVALRGICSRQNAQALVSGGGGGFAVIFAIRDTMTSIIGRPTGYAGEASDVLHLLGCFWERVPFVIR